MIIIIMNIKKIYKQTNKQKGNERNKSFTQKRTYSTNAHCNGHQWPMTGKNS